MKTTKSIYNKKTTEPSRETISKLISFARSFNTSYSNNLKTNIDWVNN